MTDEEQLREIARETVIEEAEAWDDLAWRILGRELEEDDDA